ncbi:MAG: 50S ribosomal protein L25 [Paenibacillaceae bacterium]|uniref:50S ribosomal protein L25 n=1 Tax=Paenibacillus cymbidii TaxID=1639034 RepID=UPI001080EC7D|nr:50S ribosomal protein L25 [Paenibacillus cymbidii]MBO9605904.1 50S ribosomal protein L25 [Paenibacillaceae bacterium]
MTISLKADERTRTTKSDVHVMRRNGKIPAVVYGKQFGSSPIAVDEKELLSLLRHHRHAIVELDIAGQGKHPAMITDVQRHKLSRELLHIDFHQINMDEPVKAVVALDFVGEPQGVTEGGILQIQLHELEVRALPKQLPESIAVDVGGLGIHDSLLVGQLQLPPGVEAKANADDVVASVLVPQKEPAPDDETETLAAKAEAGRELAADKDAAAAKA